MSYVFATVVQIFFSKSYLLSYVTNILHCEVPFLQKFEVSTVRIREVFVRLTNSFDQWRMSL